MPDITTTYARQIPRPEDKLREEAESVRKEQLEESAGIGTQPHPGMEAFEKSWQAEVSRVNANDINAETNMVDAAIVQRAQKALSRVEAAMLTPDQRLAKTLADELTSRGTVRFEPEQTFEEATEAERQAMEDFLADDSDDESEGPVISDRIVGVDELNRTVYRDSDTGEEYVLVHE
jgi:hypothetical protein